MPTSCCCTNINFHILVTIVSFYLPPNDHTDQRDLDDLIEQLSEPFIIIGSINGHSLLWGRGKETNPRGIQIEQMIEDHCFCLLSNGQATYFHKPT
ncbi:hypothetical protein X975_21058, partial [Stegodyphus mimosarum]